jgi:RNA-directed DNA polymerase
MAVVGSRIVGSAFRSAQSDAAWSVSGKTSRRVYIPEADGRQRLLGIAALEDNIVQHTVVTFLNQIYEMDFKGFSYGFRPGRDPHRALDALSMGTHSNLVRWVLDADIGGFFERLNHDKLIAKSQSGSATSGC